ncbi:hypothetical protein QVD17_04501 [Tagetes erecta]|uniref:Uncharacterized protein n=1 Tax=Tagetes erecta TaxID=13708 RepID=A0AAD8PAR7_TARER|nr:hypothetical protein QVD17_04501 [Tagetes erecta]
MKTTIFSLFFSLAFIICFFTVNSAPGPVLQIGETNATTGVKYYVWQKSEDGFDGSILPYNVGKGSCVAAVIHDQNDGDAHGITITPANPNEGLIHLSTDVNIKFTGSSVCQQSNVWKVKYDKGLKQYAVTTGGVIGKPGADTLDNWFKIEKTEDGNYKFVYCPSVCSSCKVMCKDVGTIIDNNGYERFVLGGNPFPIYFTL